MDSKNTSSFNIFLKFYKVLFLGLLLLAVIMTVYSALTANYSDAGDTLRSALIFAVLLWLGSNAQRLAARFKS